MTTAYEFKLVPLDCPTCGAGVRAHGEDVVYYCTACRNGYRLDPSDWSLDPVETAFVSAPHIQVQEYRPFWLLPARISITQRQASGGGFTGLLRSFLGSDPASAERGEGTFAVPAFQAPLESVTRLVRDYTQALPELREKLGEHLLGGCYGQHDAQGDDDVVQAGRERIGDATREIDTIVDVLLQDEACEARDQGRGVEGQEERQCTAE